MHDLKQAKRNGAIAVEFEDPEIVNEFVVESTEHLADIENQLLTIEAAGADIDVDLVNTVFRGVHSIKGAAGFLGLTSINELAHSLENVLNLMRERELIPTSAIVDVTLKASDELRSMIENVAGSNDVDVKSHVARLEAIASGEPLEDEPPAVEINDAGLDGADALAAAEALIAEMEAAGTTSISDLKKAPARKKPAAKKTSAKKPAAKKATTRKAPAKSKSAAASKAKAAKSPTTEHPSSAETPAAPVAKTAETAKPSSAAD